MDSHDRSTEVPSIIDILELAYNENDPFPIGIKLVMNTNCDTLLTMIIALSEVQNNHSTGYQWAMPYEYLLCYALEVMLIKFLEFMHIELIFMTCFTKCAMKYFILQY